MTDLRECPFCAGVSEIRQLGDRRRSSIFACTECGCSLENGEEFNHGTAWNTRAADARIAELEAALTEIANFTQTKNLLWWQKIARAALNGETK